MDTALRAVPQGREEKSLKAGDKVWYVPSRKHSAPSWEEVQSVGRKWVVLDRYLRLNKDTLIADGGEYSSPGRAWLTQEAHAYHVEKNARWAKFRDMVNKAGDCPAGIEVEDISALESRLLKDKAQPRQPARSA